eukprot:TCALIF_08588-PA protein Name:"Similar to DIDO1 Death-inducer obliterator 1 (Homo sapiens)" AED:0.11 eAED:0.11 QI:369/0.66/0.5/1/0.88/0.9/10/0/1492
MMMETEEPAEPVAVDSPSGEEKSVTIMIDENQKMFYDQHVLQSIIDSNQPSTQVTIVRLGGVNEAGEAGHPADLGDPTLEDTAEFVPSDMETLDLTQGGPGGGAAGSGDAQTLRDLLAHATLVETHQDPTLPPASNSITLDQEQISQLESVLQSTEAKDMLGHVMLSDEHGPLDHILTSELTPDLTASTNPLEFNVSPERPASPVNEPRPTTSETVQGRPKRRSQRRMDKEIKEEAERIRMENQALLKKEKEAWAQPHESPSTAVVKSDSVGSIPSSEVVSSPVTPIQTSVATGRPKRQRKVPAHLQGDFVTIDVSRSTAKITPVKKDDVSEPLPVSLPVEGIVDEREEARKQALIEKKDDDIEKKSPLKRTDSGKAVANISSKMPEFEKKPKGKVCFECDQTPLEHSLYCSDKCIEAHVERAKKAFACKTNNEASTTNQIIVMNPKSNQMFSGPSAPTIKTLSEWMRKHTEFHVVIPKSMPTSKFYGSQKKQSHAHAEKSKRGPKIIPPHDKATKNSDEVNQKLAEYKSMALSSLSAARETLQASLKDSNRKSESKREAQDAKRALEARRRSNEHNTVVSKRHHDPTVRKTASNVPKGEVVTPAKPKDVKALRENACKGLLDALKGRLERSKDVRMDEEKLKELVNAIEKELYDIFNKDVGLKYKNQYRRLVFNIKDPKNIGLFRKIVTGKIGPKRLVDMSPEEMASKELQQWREAELKHDIEKIKSHELEMMAMGNKLVVKSHKGEQIIETDGSVNVNDVKMPEEERILETAKETSHEMNVSTTNSGEKDGSRNHKSESSSRKDKEGSSSHHHHHHHHHRRSSSSRDKDKATSSSSSKGKDKSTTSSSDSTAISTSSSMVKIQPEEKASNNDEKSVDKIMQKIRSAKQKEEAQRQKEFSEKVAKAEKAIFEFNQTMASGGDGLDGLGTRTESVRPVETGSPTQLSSPPQEVSSTVHIKTPEIIVSESDEGSASLSPSSNPVWHGLVNMPDVANFNIKAFGLSGVSDFLRQDLDKEVLKVVGRIPPDTVWKYIVDLAEVPSKEILLIRLEAASEVEQQGYDSFFFYLKKKARLGVIGNCSKMVKDCYIIPVESEMDLPDCLRPLDPPGFEAVRGNILLALIVRTVRTRPDGSSGFRRSALKVGSKTMTPSISSGKDGKQAHKATIHVSAKKKRKVEVRVIDVDDGDEDEGEEEEYDPAKAGNMDMFTDQASEEDEEDYDPEKAFPSEDHEAQERDEPPQKKTKITTNEDSAFSPPHSPNDVFAAKLKKLAAEIAREKAEIASLAGQGDPTVIQADKRKPLIESSGPAFGLDASAKAAPGFQGLPSTISSILFGGGANESHSNSRDPRKKEAPPSSTLSSMTDADLLAKVQEMETNPTKSLPKSQVPPYPGTSTMSTNINHTIDEEEEGEVAVAFRKIAIIPEIAGIVFMTVEIVDEVSEAIIEIEVIGGGNQRMIALITDHDQALREHNCFDVFDKPANRSGGRNMSLARN